MATVVKNRLGRSKQRLRGVKPAKMTTDRTRPLTAQETEWKQRINEQLLTVLDLSLIDSVDTDKARKEIREIVERLLTEASAPLSRKQRLADRGTDRRRSHGARTVRATARRSVRYPTYWLTASKPFTSSDAANWSSLTQGLPTLGIC